jgi:hypothetical protein
LGLLETEIDAQEIARISSLFYIGPATVRISVLSKVTGNIACEITSIVPLKGEQTRGNTSK